MKDWYINSIESKIREHEEIYQQTLTEMFGQTISWEEVKLLKNDQHISLMLKLENNIKIFQSNFDIKKLATAIQHSRSGMGFCSMTQFNCAFCGETEWWGNTAVPKICSKCAEQMATNMVLMKADIYKKTTYEKVRTLS